MTIGLEACETNMIKISYLFSIKIEGSLFFLGGRVQRGKERKIEIESINQALCPAWREGSLLRKG